MSTVKVCLDIILLILREQRFLKQGSFSISFAEAVLSEERFSLLSKSQRMQPLQRNVGLYIDLPGYRIIVFHTYQDLYLRERAIIKLVDKKCNESTQKQHCFFGYRCFTAHVQPQFDSGFFHIILLFANTSFILVQTLRCF